MTKRGRSILVALMLAVLPLGATPAGAAPTYDALNPGGVTTFSEQVDVTIVYVGMGDPSADVARQLPATGSPVIRFRAFYGLPSDLGIRYRYTYQHVVPTEKWTSDFYGELDRLAGAHESRETLTLYQKWYSDPANQAHSLRTLDESKNQWIEASKVEQYLALHAPTGVDTSKPTIYFIDRSIADGWYPHVYVKTDEPDPDTGYNFGLVRSSRKLTAWGGTTPDDQQGGLGSLHRVWFYDLSAGPDGWQDGWNVDDADVDGDGTPDYRIPPAWHYVNGTYKHPGYPTPASLGTDLGKVARYVGIDLLFTSSPLYPPYYTADRIPETVNLDINTVEGWNGVDAGTRYISDELFLAKEQALPTGYTISLDHSTPVPFKDDVKNCYLQWIVNVLCYNDRVQYAPFADLFLNASLRSASFLDRDADYEAGLMNYAIGTKPKDGNGLLGFADDNWLDGTQSGVFSFVNPGAVSIGYGMTTTLIHEYGHHSSMSHPHDGYDAEAAADDTAGSPGPDGVTGDFGPGGATYFAWLGDFSNSMMSYIDLNWDFSQFDRDNSARHHAAGFALVANRIAAQIVAKGGGGTALATANGLLAAAQDAFADHDYPTALANAETAYRGLLAWADSNGVAVTVRDPSTWTLVDPAKRGMGHVKLSRGDRIDLDERANLKRMYAE